VFDGGVIFVDGGVIFIVDGGVILPERRRALQQQTLPTSGDRIQQCESFLSSSLIIFEQC
jgi:hypothetical protein